MINDLLDDIKKLVKGFELLEMLEKALKERDPVNLEEDAKYS